MKPAAEAPALYRLLLRCYPDAFRRAYGDDMARTFVEMLRAARRSHGARGATGVWAGAAWDAMTSGLRERRSLRARTRGGAVMSGFFTDLRQAMRSLSSGRGLTIATILVIALGIGANSAIFSIVNAALLRPLPYKDPDRLVLLWQTWAPLGLNQVPWTLHDFLDTREGATQLSHVALFRSGSRVLKGAEARRLRAAVVSPSLFPLLGVEPMLGRAFLPEEELPAGRDRVILGYGTWLETFGGDRGIVGSKVTLDDRPHIVVGVMPPGFAFPPPITYTDQMLAMEPDIFVPFAIFPEPRDGNHSHFVIGRLAPGASRDSATAELQAIHDELAAAYPVNQGVGAYAVSLSGQAVTTIRRSLIILLAAVACVLLVACTSIASLLTSRAIARGRELALRAALGASRPRLLRQLLFESAAMGLLAGTLGLILAEAIVAGVTRLNPMGLPGIFEASLDWRVVVFTAAASLGAAAAFGLLPAIQASRQDLSSVFRDGARATGNRREPRLKSALVIGQTAMAVLLLVFASLALRSFTALWRVDAGFDPVGLLSFQIELPQTRYAAAHERTRFADTLIRELSALPGVEQAAASTRLPFVFDQNSTNYFIEGEPVRPEQSAAQVIDRTLVTPAYFDAMSATLVWGRAISEADRGDVRVGVVNEALARRHWPDGRWEGRRIAFDVMPTDERGWIQIVGVARDMRAADLSADPEPMIYLPLAQDPQPSLFLLLRTAGDPSSAAAPARAVLRRLDPDVPMQSVKVMAERKAESVRKPKFMAMLLGGLGLLALAIATIGLYGVMAFDTSRRTREIGIRIALGARPLSVASRVTARGFALAASGIAFGLAAAFVATPALASQLYGVSSGDAASFTGAATALLAAAMLATWLPARRASKVDPAVALRAD